MILFRVAKHNYQEDLDNQEIFLRFLDFKIDKSKAIGILKKLFYLV